ncbi:MAG: YfiR family protein [Pseudomonadota bacterium]
MPRRLPLPCRAVLVMVLLWALGCGLAQAQQGQRVSAVKAAFLYKFGAFVTWPESSFKSADDPLVICVMGDEAVAADLEQLVIGRLQQGRHVVTKRISDPLAAAGTHVLYLGTPSEARLNEFIASVGGPVLVVTDHPLGLKLGSVINFSAEAGQIRFSVSLVAADQRSLKLSARLLDVARAIEGGAR